MVESRLAVCVMLAVSLQATAAVQPAPHAAATGTAPSLTVFGVPQSRPTIERLDGSLRDIAQRYPTLATGHQVRDLHAINPATRLRLASPLTTPEVLIDAITTGN